MTRISNSQLNSFQTCAKKYEYSYVKRIRTKSLKSALLFGSAFDAASSVLFLERDLVSAKRIFEENWKSQKDCSDLKNAKIDYFKSDLDVDLLTEQELVNSTMVQSWYSLRAKGLIMLDALNRDILPRLGKVFAVQELISLINDEGDEIIGYVDLIAEIDGQLVILDVKTASSLYEDDAVRFSQQLTLYTHILEPKYNTRKAGYIVIGKKLNKLTTKICNKCGFKSSSKHKTCNNEIEVSESQGYGNPPKIEKERCDGEWNETTIFTAPTQVIVSEINKQTEKIVLENLDAINTSIKNGVFTRNFEACQNQFGSPCEYIGLCWSNDMTGLEIKEEKVLTK